MFDVHAFGIAVRLAITVIAIALVVRYMLQPTLVEMFRQRVFEIRRAMFIARLDGKVSPSDPSYQMLLRQMNGVIRVADAFSFTRMLLHVIAGADPEAPDELDSQLEHSEPGARELLTHFRIRLGYEMVRHMTLTSPLAWGFLVILLPLRAIGSIRRAGVRTGERLGARPAVKRLEAEAGQMLADDFAQAA